jgi:hypothetical protein
MVSSSEVPRNAERAQRDGRAASWVTSAAKSIIRAEVPKDTRPDDSYSYQPSPEPSQYPAFDNTH